MSGRKQHYIPQAVQRAFAAGQTSAKTQVFVFRKGRAPYLTATDGSGAERDFYSNPLADGNDALDDSITDFEARHLGYILRDLRAVERGPVDAELASIAVVHLAFRTAHMRSTMAAMAGDALDKMQSLITDSAAIRQFIEVDSASAESTFVTTVTEELAKQGLDALPKTSRSMFERIVRFRVRERFEDMFEPLRDTAQRKVGEFRDGSAHEIAKAHARSLAKSLVPEERRESLASLNWTIVPTVTSADHFILPDCVVVGRPDMRSPFQPFALISTDEVGQILMPVSARKLLVGYRTTPEVDQIHINSSFARCSDEFFISSVRDVPTAQLAEIIGSFSRELDMSVIGSESLNGLAPIASINEKPRSPRIRVPSGKFCELTQKLVRSLLRSEIEAEVTTHIGSIVVTANIDGELRKMMNRTPTAQETRDAQGGSAITSKEESTWRAQILLPRNLMDACLRDLVPARRSLAMRIVKQHYGRANYFGWLVRQCPGMFEEQPDSEWTLVTRNLMVKAATEYFAGLNLRQHEDSQFASLAVLEQGPRLAAAFEAMDRVRRNYSVHSDVTRVVREAIDPVGTILISSASVAGQLEALDMSLDPRSAAGRVLVDRGLWHWYELFVDDLARHHNARHSWTAATAFGLLPTHVERLLWTIGVAVSPTGNDFWVDVLSDAQFALTLRMLSS